LLDPATGSAIYEQKFEELGNVNSVSFSNGLLATAHQGYGLVQLWRPKCLLRADHD
jgi:hypothetical protein